MHPDDEELVARASAGDDGAYSALCSKYRPYVTAICAKIVGPDDTEDVAQEVFVQAWRSLGSLRTSGALASWLAKIATHLCLNRIRTKSRVVVPIDQVLEEHLPDPQQLESDAVSSDYVERILQCLSEADRDLAILLYGGLSKAEISRMLGVPEATIRSRAARLRPKMMELMADADRVPKEKSE